MEGTTITEAQAEAIKAMHAAGNSRREIERQLGVSVHRQRQILGPAPARSTVADTRVRHQIYIDPDLMETAASKASELGYRLRAGHNAGTGSVALLLEAIARGEVVIYAKNLLD